MGMMQFLVLPLTIFATTVAVRSNINEFMLAMNICPAPVCCKSSEPNKDGVTLIGWACEKKQCSDDEGFNFDRPTLKLSEGLLTKFGPGSEYQALISGAVNNKQTKEFFEIKMEGSIQCEKDFLEKSTEQPKPVTFAWPGWEQKCCVCTPDPEDQYIKDNDVTSVVMWTRRGRCSLCSEDVHKEDAETFHPDQSEFAKKHRVGFGVISTFSVESGLSDGATAPEACRGWYEAYKNAYEADEAGVQLSKLIPDKNAYTDIFASFVSQGDARHQALKSGLGSSIAAVN